MTCHTVAPHEATRGEKATFLRSQDAHSDILYSRRFERGPHLCTVYTYNAVNEVQASATRAIYSSCEHSGYQPLCPHQLIICHTWRRITFMASPVYIHKQLKSPRGKRASG